MSAFDEIFAPDYTGARDRFRAAVEAAGGRIETHVHPLRGARGEILSTDVALFGDPEARGVLVVVSGVHGVEGYCGSGAQIAWLKSGALSRLKPGLRVVLIHALNPWGFSHDTRTTEDGSDLCRNFVDFAAPPAPQPAYEEIAAALVPEDWFGPGKAEADRLLAEVERRAGPRGLVATIARGQYTHPFGPFYGGIRPAWSNLLFTDLVRRHVAGARKVACVDYHTGLGDPGEGQLLLFHAPGSANEAAARRVWGSRAAQTVTGESVAYELTGSILGHLEALLPEARVIAGAYEFGTVPPDEVFLYGLRADRWLARYAQPGAPEAEALRRRVRAAFYVETDTWKARVAEQAISAHDDALDFVQSGD